MKCSTSIMLADLLPGSSQRVVVNGRELCLFHLSDGVFATDNLCTHQRASLAQGDILEDSVVECLRHGSRFAIRTGENRSLPATTPLATYPVTIEDGMIYVDIEENHRRNP